MNAAAIAIIQSDHFRVPEVFPLDLAAVEAPAING
jgi:hypothetical protein